MTACFCDTPMYGTVVLNGMQVVRCTLPALGCYVTTQAEVSTEVAGDNSRDGTCLDALFVAPHAPAHAYAFQGTMAVTYTAHDGSFQETAFELGSVDRAGGSAHVAHHVEGVPVRVSVTVAHDVRCVLDAQSLVERQLVAEVVGILENPRLNKEQGSLSSVLMNNKAKESVLYDRVVGERYNKSWSDFLRAHSEVFTVFYYEDAVIRDRNLAPHIKRSDARVHMAARPARLVHAGDEARCAALRAGEADLQAFLVDALSAGPLAQKALLARLKHCRGFTELLFPTSSLLMRFLACHRDTFAWAAGADEPTRVGLAAEPECGEPAPSLISEDEARWEDVDAALAPGAEARRRQARSADEETSSEATTPGHSHSWASSRSQASAADLDRVHSHVTYRHDPYAGGYVYEQVSCAA